MPHVRVWSHHATDHPGLIRDAFERRGYDVSVELVGEHGRPSALADIDVLLILGSTDAVYDPAVNAAWLATEMQEMAVAIASDIPVFGICFGSQMLCQHFGGTVARAPEHEVGWFDISLDDLTFPANGPWFQFHFDRSELPPSAHVLAHSPRAVQAFTLGRTLGVQFHPEVDARQLEDWFRDDESVREGKLDVTEMLAFAERNDEVLRRNADDLVAYFLRTVVEA